MMQIGALKIHKVTWPNQSRHALFMNFLPVFQKYTSETDGFAVATQMDVFVKVAL